MHEDLPIGSFRYIAISLSITIAFFIIELVGGILTNSLALLTDAWHMLNDVLSLSFALLAAWISQWPITKRRTYGYQRSEVIAAFLNGVFLWIIVIFIFFEAFQRINQPVEVESFKMLIIALLGLVANGLSAVNLSRSKDESLNVKGAFLHVVADTLGSMGAITAGVIIYFTRWYQVDSVISIIIGVLILYSSWRLIRDSLNILLEGVPANIDVNAVEDKIINLEGIKSVHDLHVWCITPSMTCALSAHVVVGKEVDRKMLISTIIDILKEDFGIDHTTIQLEDEDYPKSTGEH